MPSDQSAGPAVALDLAVGLRVNMANEQPRVPAVPFFGKEQHAGAL